MEELIRNYVFYVGGSFLIVLVAFLSLLFIFAHSKNKKK